MKQFFLYTGVWIFAAFLLSSFSLRESPQDPPRGKKKERHITLVKVDSGGKRIELDTILTNNDVLVWNGDTIRDMDKMTWIPDGDSLMEYRFDVLSKDFRNDHDVMAWHDSNRDNNVFVVPRVPGVPEIPPVPPVPAFRFIGKGNDRNVINLSDPDVISFKKKKLKDGREKITIVRNEPKEKGEANLEEFIIDSKGSHPAFWSDGPRVHKVMVTKDIDGKTTIAKKGKIIRLKEIGKDDAENGEIEVEVEENQENN